MHYNEIVKKIFETTPDMVAVLDEDGKILDCNHHLVKNTGYEKKDLIGIIGPIELVDEKDRERAMREFGKVKTDGINLNVPVLVKRKNNSVFPSIWSGSILHDESNKISGYLVTGKDLSEIHELNDRLLRVQKELNEEKLAIIEKLELSERRARDQYKELKKTYEVLSKTEERYRNLYEHSPDLLRTISEDGIVVDCNEKYASSLGYTKDEVVGKSIYEHTSKKSLKELSKGMEEWKKTGRIKNQTIWMKRKDGTEFPTLLSGTNLYDDTGKMIGRTVSLRDMTETYSAKEALEEEKAKRLMTVGELTSRFSHDVRNPLSVIHNATDLLKMRLQGTDENISLLINMIEESIARISYQIEDILNFVRSSDIRKESCSLLEILGSCVTKISLPDNVRINMPKGDLQVYCDKVKLEVVFENIINNAIQAIDNNKGEITIKTEKKLGYDVIEISDSGPGIPSDILPQIFKPLFTTKSSGTGLGLPTCKNLIEQHGWTIDVRLPSTFVIKIPHRR